jgi:hypothetical protein
MLISTVGRDGVAQRALAQAYRLSTVDVHLPSVSGPLILELAPRQTPRASAALDRWLAPRWRVPRHATAVL